VRWSAAAAQNAQHRVVSVCGDTGTNINVSKCVHTQLTRDQRWLPGITHLLSTPTSMKNTTTLTDRRNQHKRLVYGLLLALS
jgi:hypothetical protein